MTEEMTITDAKAMVYDRLAIIEKSQLEIKQLNGKIQELSNELTKTADNSGKPKKEAKG